MKIKHPGEILLENFIKPIGICPDNLAIALDVRLNYMNSVINGTARITEDFARSLASYLGTSAGMWIGLQFDYDEKLAIWNGRADSKEISAEEWNKLSQVLKSHE